MPDREQNQNVYRTRASDEGRTGWQPIATAPGELMPWVLVAPNGVHWLGHARDEAGAWTAALGWPDACEIAEYKNSGWYAAQATVTWKRPEAPHV